ncbi:MAG: glucose-6-phosphate dehydrogenase, partial [Patescibacteria group bacterium]|nr:glucose-6-phosphate dehydrogenase [Patescibacteria group bacterium]
MKPEILSVHKATALPPTILTIFGATGDLSADYLLPALLHMHQHRMLPADFRLVCVGRRPLDSQKYLAFILKKSSVLRKLPLKIRQNFLKRLVYYQGDFDQPESFANLAKILSDIQKPKHTCYNRLFYFATNPHQFAAIARILKSQGLLNTCLEHGRQSRVLVEKPFGFNLKSAQSLNRLLLEYFKEEQIYRIDHYVGKETVQNLMVVRFANSLFEPLWNNRFIDHVEISV